MEGSAGSARAAIARICWSRPGAIGAALAATIVAVGPSSPTFWPLLVACLPLYLAYASYRRARRMSELHLATVEALALAIDAKDQTGHNHIRRVRIYMTGLTRAIGMSAPEVEAAQMAALLHDIGKLAVPDHILAKPGPLTPEEFQKVCIHPQVAAGILRGVPFPHPVAPLILSHHERWDGRGYPAGLAGESIPVGARVLSVVDYFDALTSERPYHEAMSVDSAIGLLRREGGKALDPRLVEVFLRLLPRMRADIQALGLETAAFSASSADAGNGPQPPNTEHTPASAFEDIALAHREIYALYEIAQAMGTSLGVADTMAVITSKLSGLVPFSACALFLHSESTDTLQCHYATGVDAALLEHLSIQNGRGLTGWVGRTHRALMNGHPGADLDAAGSTRPTSLQTALVCPLLAHDKFIGTLAVYHVEPYYYRDDHRRLLERVSEQAAAVIRNAVIFEQTHEDSFTDQLTGLPNMRSMFLHLSRELSRADRLKTEVALVVMDLDDFKEINDTFGHHVGDLALQAVAKALRAAVRPYDRCVRYAGDEFIIILAGCGTEEAELKRAELQATIDNVELEIRPDLRVPMLVSAGAAVFPHDGDSYEALLAKADRRMYRDKSKRKSERTRRLMIDAATNTSPGSDRVAAV